MTVAADYDVDARLAQGRPAVDDISEYVRACQQLGYHHPDLTQHPAQVRDWYSGEDGLQLDALAADAAALTALAAAADDALRRQADLLEALSSAWVGQGAGAAMDFLMRHHRAAAMVSAAVREAAEAITALRDDLWRAVDAKVRATLAVDSGIESQRAAWLAAARTVSTGAGDRSTASELIDQQVKPFVDNDVRLGWLGAMRTVGAEVASAYAAAIDRVRAGPVAVFEVPGDLGPRWTAPVAPRKPVGGDVGPVAEPTRVATLDPLPSPVGAASPAAVAPAGFAAPPAPPAPGVPLAAPAPPSLPSSPLGDLGGMPSLGTPSLGTGLSGFGQQLADLIGGLTGSADAPSPDLNPPDLASHDEPSNEPDPDAEGKKTDPADAAPAEPAVPEDPAPEEPEVPSEPSEPTPTPVPAPMPEPPPAQAVVAAPAEPTPCQIAADELPQVGE